MGLFLSPALYRRYAPQHTRVARGELGVVHAALAVPSYFAANCIFFNATSRSCFSTCTVTFHKPISFALDKAVLQLPRATGDQPSR
jgi:hypothetical protein